MLCRAAPPHSITGESDVEVGAAVTTTWTDRRVGRARAEWEGSGRGADPAAASRRWLGGFWWIRMRELQ